jgi:hypothetical protein
MCPEGRIAEVVVMSHSVFDRDDVTDESRFAWAYRLANSLHVPTRPEVVHREVLFAVGDCYDVELLRDSERLLRAFDFLAAADIYGVRLPSGEVQVVVDTQDEWSTRVDPRIRSNGGLQLRGLRLREDNLAGTGRHLSLFVDREGEERVFGITYFTPHFLRTRWNMGLRFARTEVGPSHHQSVAYPFVGETGRVAFRQSLERDDRYFEAFIAQPSGDLALVQVPVSRRQLEVGSAVRWGTARYRHSVFGLAVAGEWIDYPGEAVVQEDTDHPMRQSPPVWTPVSSMRLMMLAGQRNVYYTRHRGLDTLRGIEDVELGVETEATLGPTLPVVSEERDIAVGFGFYAAGELDPRTIVGGRFTFEARRAYHRLAGLPEWNDALAQLDTWAYVRPSPASRHLFVASLAAVGGWHGRGPFQLTLGGDTGLRGFPRHTDPGGRRVVGSLEQRTYLGAPFDLLDLGSVAFLDVGKIWPGHGPFGTESPVRVSVGAGLRTAFPPGSRQTYRLDVGFPIQGRGTGSGVAVSLGVGQAIGRQVVRRDPQLLRSTRYGLFMSDFLHPVRP